MGASAALRAGARAALLGGHGAVAWGRDVRQAFYQAELLEAACQLAASVDAARASVREAGR
jgi:ribulose-5-phosphate 4-epimerase/fuculose-1-phosphate aldolase